MTDRKDLALAATPALLAVGHAVLVPTHLADILRVPPSIANLPVILPLFALSLGLAGAALVALRHRPRREAGFYAPLLVPAIALSLALPEILAFLA